MALVMVAHKQTSIAFSDRKAPQQLRTTTGAFMAKAEDTFKNRRPAIAATCMGAHCEFGARPVGCQDGFAVGPCRPQGLNTPRLGWH